MRPLRRRGGAMTDVVEALVGSGAALFHSSAVKMVETTFVDAKSLTLSLFGGASGTPKSNLDKVKKDFEPLVEAGSNLADKITPEVAKAKAAVVTMAAELAKPFSLASVTLALVDFATVMRALGASIDHVADAVAAKEPNAARREEVRHAVIGIKTPWAEPFLLAGAGMTKDFDTLCRDLFGIENGTNALLDVTTWDRASATITAKLVRECCRQRCRAAQARARRRLRSTAAAWRCSSKSTSRV